MDSPIGKVPQPEIADKGALVTIRRQLVDTDFGQIHVRICGHGPAIVMAHINQQSSDLYAELMRELAPDFTSIAVDYPSHGMSDHIPFQPTIGDYAECIVQVLDRLGITKAVALGEATGAAVATELGGSHAEHIPAVILLNCPFYKNRKQADTTHAPLKQTFRPSDASGFPLTRTLDFMLETDPAHAPLHPTQDWMDRINLAQIQCGRHRWQALDALNAYDVGEGLKRIEGPVLLLMGEHFHYAGIIHEYRERIRRLDAIEIIPDGRFCLGWEKANDVAALVSTFLRPHRSLVTM
ncbi:alpha/beta hydrolase [Mesorhizobium sp. CAU 1741]|uniref:alpha/beta fold hydrolase n=1 Tax=Mesorhizobium sp. CAU 1741 TaxID=3140366 RepID=UPI00325B95CE